ncbi:AvrD family protein [Microbacterium aurum]|uniref:AvrD family protein n=1 Tax=Microbacterium aurum TaxID=36805 RepID=UPI0028E6B644|nr:AvrD family protein [Microbacterium aurum]
MAEETIESQLGAARGRFFGYGYSQVRHTYSVQQLDKNGAVYTASVVYPMDWSEKNGAVQAPHLASVDAMALAVSIAEDYLGRPEAGGPFDLTYARIRSCELVPGTRPVTDLIHMAVRVDVEQSPSADTSWACTVAIGSFRVRLAVNELCPTAWADRETVGEVTYFGGGFRSVERGLGVVSTRDGALFEATGRVSEAVPPLRLRPGVDLGYNETASMVDALVFCAQVGQVAIYALDGLERRETDTLWLRRAQFVRTDEIDVDDVCRVLVVRTSLLKRNASRWRTADLIGSYGSVEVRFRLAHALAAEPARVGVA